MTTCMRVAIATAVFALALASRCATAQDGANIGFSPQTATGETEANGTTAPSKTPLNDEQESIRIRFDRFEDTLYKMAQYLQKSEPARAELVLRALSQSKEERVADRMKAITRLLSKQEGKSPQFADAIEEQDAILANLRELLTILRSEDILDENRKEQERLKELARQVAALIDAEKIHHADTQRGEPTDRVAKGQERTARRTGDIVKEIDEHDRSTNERDKPQGDKDSEEQDSDSEMDGQQPAEDSQNGQQKESDKSQKGQSQKSQSQKGTDGQPKQGDDESEQQNESPDKQSSNQDQQNQSGKPSDSKPQQGQQGEQGQQSQQGQQGEQSQEDQKQQDGQQSQSDQSSDPPRATPGREELEAAREKMERAIEELKQQNRENASKEQEEAIEKLIEAKERIEELLRQLREEERELLLRALEARFQKMLQLQQVVLDTTVDLNGLTKDQWQDREFGRCRDAATMEREIVLEADKALEVLRADGSSVAFPEAVAGIRTDVLDIAARLGREDAGELTISIEREVIDALEEMILALQKEMEKIREQKGQQGQQGSPGEPGLVDQLAELKMLKTLQLRINRRTKTLGRLFNGEQATEDDVIDQLRELAERQGRLQRATYDLATGKTAN